MNKKLMLRIYGDNLYLVYGDPDNCLWDEARFIGECRVFGSAAEFHAYTHYAYHLCYHRYDDGFHGLCSWLVYPKES